MPPRFFSLRLACAVIVFAASSLGSAPVGAQAPPPPKIPAAGIALSDADRAELTASTEKLGQDIEAYRKESAANPPKLRFLPDVEIFYNAVHYPLKYDEFYSGKDIETARRLLAEGSARLAALQQGKMPWTTQTGLVVLGYVSHIDGSVQPYGISVPDAYARGEGKKLRLDFFLHGRDEKLTELHYIDQREKSPGEFTPADTFVLQPYGRYCNANRFAGERDLFEALADAERRYPIDPDRIVMRGFSMGGASCWQFATHFADQWAAAAPGAGFTETAFFTNRFAPDKTPPTWYEQTLWHWYDSVDYAVNLAQCPTVAYSGEIDGQRKAADNMNAAMDKVGLKLTQVIGPNTAHRYAPESKPEINKFVDEHAERGRNTMPMEIRFTTWTLRYNAMDWLTVDGLGKEWTRANVEATRSPEGGVTLKTENVSALSLDVPSIRFVVIDGDRLPAARHFARAADGLWKAAANASAAMPPKDGVLHKRHGLQGPIDDAFMDRFVMVRPTGTALNSAVGDWVNGEMAHALGAWRAMFRGEAPVVDDAHVTADQIANANLVLWGDPRSNTLIAKIAPKLPIRWDADGTLHAAGKTYPAGATVPVLIYPNPLNPSRYVVINSGITFREADYTNNALQTAKLPDWAIINIMTPPDAHAPGKVVDAGFFDETWK